VYPNIPTEDQTEDLTPPPTPTGFSLEAGITNVFITHDAPIYTQGRGHDRTIVYGAKRNSGDPLPTFAQATRIADFIGEVYGYPTDPATIWHMWITWRTRDGVESVTPAGGINGLQVRTGEDVQRLLDALNGQITGSELNAELSQVIDDSMVGVKYLATQYGMRVQVAADGRRLIGGYGLMGTNSAERGPSIDFGVLASQFYVGAPAENGGISSTRPFIVQTTPTVINGVSVPAGVYM
jgi:phosphotransferase system HPr-like phosphotransfer protein